MKHFFAVLIASLLFLSMFNIAQAQQDVVFINLSGYRWNKTTLNALVITNENDTWWQPYFTDLTLKAVDQWNEAFQFFSAKNPDYAYLSSLSIVGAISNDTILGYDIYINFSDSVFVNGQQALGLTTTYVNINNIIENCSIVLSSRSGSLDLSGSDQRDVANHELGHALGLGHSNSSADLMYPNYDLFSTDNAISTLDLYAVTILFSQILSPSNLSDSIPPFTSLPSNIAFEYAPIAEPEPKGISDNLLFKSLEILLNNPYMAIMVVSLIMFLIVVWSVYRGTRKRTR